VTELLLAQPSPPALEAAPPPGGPQRRRRRRRAWATVLACTALVGSALGYLLADAVGENHHYDRARYTLYATRATTDIVSVNLHKARVDLNLVTQQVGSDTTTLAQDASELEGTRSALSAAQAHVFEQAALLNSLHACLGGVEQSLNALAVGSQAKAADALRSVSSSCAAAVNASG
jgi:hypothetical protein